MRSSAFVSAAVDAIRVRCGKLIFAGVNAKNRFVILEEKCENRSWNVECRREHNGNVAYGHFVRVCMIDDLDQESNQVPEKGTIGLWESFYEPRKSCDPLGLIWELFSNGLELGMKIPCQYGRGQFA